MMKTIALLCLFGTVFLLASCNSGRCKKTLDVACECSSDSSGDDVTECSEATMGRGLVCCKGADRCSCYKYDCSRNGDYCTCAPTGPGTTEACTGEVCCAAAGQFAGSCTCQPGVDVLGVPVVECTGDSVKVPSCSLDEIRCSPGEERVDRCEG